MKVAPEDSLFSKIVRTRDGWTCQRCGAKHPENSQGLHCSHFIGRANQSTRFELDNCDALCNGCHQYLETHKATIYRQWKIEQLGEDRFSQLEQLSNKMTKRTKKDKIELRKVFRQHLKEMDKTDGLIGELNNKEVINETN